MPGSEPEGVNVVLGVQSPMMVNSDAVSEINDIVVESSEV